MSNVIYKRCPYCKFAQGFSLDNKTILKDEKYLCPYCGKEHKFTHFKKCEEKDYNEEVKAIKVIKKNKLKIDELF